MAKISTSTNIDNIHLREQAVAPTTPAAGYGRLYAKADGLYFIGSDGVEIGPLKDKWPTVTVFTREGDLEVASNPLKIFNLSGLTRTISKVFLSVDAAPTGAAVIVDVLKNGTTIFADPGNRPFIADGATSGQSEAVDVTEWSDGEYLTVEIAQVGATNPGADLVIHIVSL